MTMEFLSCFVNANCILIFHRFVLENSSGLPFLSNNPELHHDLHTLDANNSSVDNNDSIVRSCQLASEFNAENNIQNGGQHLHSSRCKTDELMPKSGSEVKEGDTPLCIASRQADDNTVRHLLEHGAKVNMRNTLGESPLLIACKNGSVKTVKLLLENRADVLDVCNLNVVNPLCKASDNNYHIIAEQLVKMHYGTEIN